MVWSQLDRGLFGSLWGLRAAVCSRAMRYEQELPHHFGICGTYDFDPISVGSIRGPFSVFS
jgi:hypothetical protein